MIRQIVIEIIIQFYQIINYLIELHEAVSAFLNAKPLLWINQINEMISRQPWLEGSISINVFAQ